jgi:phosphate transport system permease protein
VVTRHLFKLGNRDVTGATSAYFIDDFMGRVALPRGHDGAGAARVGRFLRPAPAVLEGGPTVAEGEAVWPEFQQRLKRSNDVCSTQIRRIERHEIGNINFRLERCASISAAPSCAAR